MSEFQESSVSTPTGIVIKVSPAEEDGMMDKETSSHTSEDEVQRPDSPGSDRKEPKSPTEDKDANAKAKEGENLVQEAEITSPVTEGKPENKEKEGLTKEENEEEQNHLEADAEYKEPQKADIVHGEAEEGTVHGEAKEDIVHGEAKEGTVHGEAKEDTVHGEAKEEKEEETEDHEKDDKERNDAESKVDIQEEERLERKEQKEEDGRIDEELVKNKENLPGLQTEYGKVLEQFCRKWKLESTDNINNFYKALKVGMVKRKMSPPSATKKLVIRQDDKGQVTVISKSAMVNNQTKFKLQEECKDVGPTGKKASSVYTLDTNKLVRKQTCGKHKIENISEIKDGKLVITLKVGAVTAVCKYKPA